MSRMNMTGNRSKTARWLIIGADEWAVGAGTAVTGSGIVAFTGTGGADVTLRGFEPHIAALDDASILVEGAAIRART